MAKKGQRNSARETAREMAMRLAYAWSISGEGDLSTLMQFADEQPVTVVDSDYLSLVIEGVKKKHTELDELIERNSIDWKLDRLAKVELAILRVAIYEMAYSKDVPTAVAMHEAVELAKQYCRPQAPPFINGILSAIKTALEENAALAYVPSPQA